MAVETDVGTPLCGGETFSSLAAIEADVAKGTFTDCPKCGAHVTKEKLRRHLNTVHGEGGKKTPPPTAVAGPTVKFPWKAMAALAIVGVLVFATGYYVLGRIPSGGGPTPNTLPVAVLETSLGTMRIELDTLNAPRTAANFIGLVRAGFYDGLTFHRVVADFVIQGGDPNGDGTGGSGTTVTWEDTGLRNTLHTIAMARSQSPDSATSQFFINLKDNTNLDTPPAYVVFGRVIDGHGVVTSIGSVPTDANDKPLSSVTMTRVYMES